MCTWISQRLLTLWIIWYCYKSYITMGFVLCPWLVTSYLSNRSQLVTCNGVKSIHNNVKCCMPQGSILGPLLFLYIKGRLKSIAWSTSVRCMELHDRKWCVEASNLKISVLPIVTRYVTIDTTHGCLGLIRQPHPRVIVMTGRASLVRECKQMTEWSSSGSSCGSRAVSGIPIPNSHHQVH